MKPNTVLAITLVVGVVVAGIVYFTRSHYRTTLFIDPNKLLTSVTLQSRTLNGPSITVANPDDLGMIRVWLDACGNIPFHYIDPPAPRDSIILTYEDGSQVTISANISGDPTDASNDSIEGDAFIHSHCTLYAPNGAYDINVIPKSLCPPSPAVELHKLIPALGESVPSNSTH